MNCLELKIKREENIKNFKNMIKFYLVFGLIIFFLLSVTGCCRVATTSYFHHMDLRKMVSCISGSADVPMEIRKSAHIWLMILGLNIVFAWVGFILCNNKIMFYIFSALFLLVA